MVEPTKACAPLWTAEEVAQRFKEAATTSSRLAPVRVQGYLSSWPAFMLQPSEPLDRDGSGYRPMPPSPRDEARMLQAMNWVQWLEVEQRHLVWMCAQRSPWCDICARFACSRTTAWRRWQRCLEAVASRLNADAVPKSDESTGRPGRRPRSSRWDV